MGSIVWVAGYPKSGNTWVRAFLANLVANRDRPLPLSDLPHYCDDEARPELYSALAGRPSTELGTRQLCALRAQVHAGIAARAAGLRFVKTHNLLGAYDGYPLHNMAATSAMIYVVRNPLDVVVSMTAHFGLSLDEAIDMLASDDCATANEPLFVSQILTSWSRHVQSWTSAAGPQSLTVRYEDLIEKPVKFFSKVARLVGMDGDRKRIERAAAHASFKTLSALESRDGFVETSSKATRFFRVGRVNQWRERLSPGQIARVVATHREQMRAFDYLPKAYV